MTPSPKVVINKSIFFRDLAYVFVAAALGGVVARLARLPLILGYVRVFAGHLCRVRTVRHSP